MKINGDWPNFPKIRTRLEFTTPAPAENIILNVV